MKKWIGKGMYAQKDLWGKHTEGSPLWDSLARGGDGEIAVATPVK